MKFLLLAVLLSTVPTSTKVDLVVEDSTGAPVKDVLVIVQDLDNQQHELTRVLSDGGGRIPTLDLPSGLYRAIGTSPYGLWQTDIKEFVVGNNPEHLALRVRPKPSHGNGDIITAGTQKRKLKAVTADGQPASGAEIYVRDREATTHLERRYIANSLGEAEIELVGEPTVVVVVLGNSLSARETTYKDGDFTVRLP